MKEKKKTHIGFVIGHRTINDRRVFQRRPTIIIDNMETINNTLNNILKKNPTTVIPFGNSRKTLR